MCFKANQQAYSKIYKYNVTLILTQIQSKILQMWTSKPEQITHTTTQVRLHTLENVLVQNQPTTYKTLTRHRSRGIPTWSFRHISCWQIQIPAGNWDIWASTVFLYVFLFYRLFVLLSIQFMDADQQKGLLILADTLPLHLNKGLVVTNFQTDWYVIVSQQLHVADPGFHLAVTLRISRTL